MIRLKRVYEPPSPEDGFRILIERLWPRGLTKAAAAVDLWTKDVAPSPALRKWYAHDPARWQEFQKRYRHELETNGSAVDQLRSEIRSRKNVTFVYSAQDPDRNSALLLRQYLAGKIKG